MKCRTTILVEIGFDNWTKFCQSSLLLFLWSMVVQFELYTSRQFGNYRSFMWFHHQSVVQQGNSNPPQVPFIHRDFNKNAAFHLMHISGLFGPSRNHFKHLTLLGYIGSQNSTVTKVSTQINQKTPGQFYFRWGDSDGLVRRCFFSIDVFSLVQWVCDFGVSSFITAAAAGFHGLSSAAACCVSLVALWA